MNKKYTQKEMLRLGYLPLVLDDFKVHCSTWGKDFKEGKHLEMDIYAENVRGRECHQHMIFINKEKFIEMIRLANKIFKLKERI